MPVAPAAHYLIGGVRPTSTAGRRSRGCSPSASARAPGLHGANRLASNSLSECFVFGRRAAETAAAEPGRANRPNGRPDWRFAPPTERTREAVWRLAGPGRDAAASGGADLRPDIHSPS